MADPIDWQSAAAEFWGEVRATLREREKTAGEAEECIRRYRRRLHDEGVSEGLVFHRGVEATAAAAAHAVEMAYR